MQIVKFERDDDNPGFCFGAAGGEGLTFLFVADNSTGRIEHLEELVAGERFVIADADVPMFLKTLIGAKCADERWRRGEGPVVVDLRAEP